MFGPIVTSTLDDVLPLAIDRYGSMPQCLKACEELGELQTALCKWMIESSPASRNLFPNKENVQEEIADVLIMAFQLRSLFGSSAVDAQILFKLDRLRTNLEKNR